MRRAGMYFGAGLLLFLTVSATIGWWIYCCSVTASFESAKSAYLALFPNEMQNAFLLTVINIVLLVIAIACFSKAQKGMRNGATVMLVISSILLAWQVFSLM